MTLELTEQLKQRLYHKRCFRWAEVRRRDTGHRLATAGGAVVGCNENHNPETRGVDEVRHGDREVR
ncbi:MAG: hypothetical protein ACREMZ_15965 [Gemmatimonadales bacterium]